MQLEMELGFRSSFNFVPEGDYRVPGELREELTDGGFEVGIHDLKHDGHLFASHRIADDGVSFLSHLTARRYKIRLLKKGGVQLHTRDEVLNLNCPSVLWPLAYGQRPC